MQVQTSNNHRLWIRVHLILLPVGFGQNRKSEQGWGGGVITFFEGVVFAVSIHQM